MNLKDIVLVAHEGGVRYGVIIAKRTVLQKGNEVEIFVVETPCQSGDGNTLQLDRNEEEICKVGRWNDQVIAEFIREKGGGEWATKYAKDLEPVPEITTTAPAPAPAAPNASPEEF